MAKRGAGRRGRKPGRGRKASAASLSGELANQLAKLDEQREKAIADLQEQRVGILHAAIEAKEKELAQAQEALEQATQAVSIVENALYTLKVQAGLVKEGSRRGKSGRKPRITLDAKQAAVAESLKNVRSGASFRELRAMLLDLKDAASGGPIFATTDFNSSSKFGDRFLPKGWKIKGERRDATIVKA